MLGSRNRSWFTTPKAVPLDKLTKKKIRGLASVVEIRKRTTSTPNLVYIADSRLLQHSHHPSCNFLSVLTELVSFTYTWHEKHLRKLGHITAK